MIEKNKVYFEDCLITMRNMPENFIDMVLTSPPYDDIREYGNVSTWNLDIFKKIALQLKRILKPGGVIVWVVSDKTSGGSETGSSFRQALYFKEIGLRLHDTMIYKTNKAPQRWKLARRFQPEFEYMFVLSKNKKPKTFNPILVPAKHSGTVNKSSRRHADKLKDDKYTTRSKKIKGNIWHFDSGYCKTTLDHFAYKHPAMFPEKLALDHIGVWTSENDLVYDPFMGAGTTAKACVILNRFFIGSEINKDYREIIERRIREAS